MFRPGGSSISRTSFRPLRGLSPVYRPTYSKAYFTHRAWFRRVTVRLLNGLTRAGQRQAQIRQQRGNGLQVPVRADVNNANNRGSPSGPDENKKHSILSTVPALVLAGLLVLQSAPGLADVFVQPPGINSAPEGYGGFLGSFPRVPLGPRGPPSWSPRSDTSKAPPPPSTTEDLAPVALPDGPCRSLLSDTEPACAHTAHDAGPCTGPPRAPAGAAVPDVASAAIAKPQERAGQGTQQPGVTVPQAPAPAGTVTDESASIKDVPAARDIMPSLPQPAVAAAPPASSPALDSTVPTPGTERQGAAGGSAAALPAASAAAARQEGTDTDSIAAQPSAAVAVIPGSPSMDSAETGQSTPKDAVAATKGDSSVDEPSTLARAQEPAVAAAPAAGKTEPASGSFQANGCSCTCTDRQPAATPTTSQGSSKQRAVQLAEGTELIAQDPGQLAGGTNLEAQGPGQLAGGKTLENLAAQGLGQETQPGLESARAVSTGWAGSTSAQQQGGVPATASVADSWQDGRAVQTSFTPAAGPAVDATEDSRAGAASSSTDASGGLDLPREQLLRAAVDEHAASPPGLSLSTAVGPEGAAGEAAGGSARFVQSGLSMPASSQERVAGEPAIDTARFVQSSSSSALSSMVTESGAAAPAAPSVRVPAATAAFLPLDFDIDIGGKKEAYSPDQARTLISEVWEIVNENYLDARGNGFNKEKWAALRDEMLAREYSSPAGARRAIREMLARGVNDRYSRYLTIPELDALRKYDNTGVGLNLGSADEYRRRVQYTPPSGATGQPGEPGVWVIASLQGSNADAAGIKRGYKVLEVNGVDVQKTPPFQVASMIRGPPEPETKTTAGPADTASASRTVSMKVLDSNGDVQTVTMSRGTFAVPNPVNSYLNVALNGADGPPRATCAPLDPLNPCLVTVDLNLATGVGGTKQGYIKLKSFNSRAQAEVAAAVKKLQEQGAQEFILDLQFNGGGLLNQGVEVAQIFLPPGSVIAQQQDARTNTTVQLKSAGDPVLTTTSLVVLVNENTASAAEVLAGALRDNCRAVLSGKQTYGKGVIQSVYELSDRSGLVLTVARYMTPDGTNIDRNGITPDFSYFPPARSREPVLEACRVKRGLP